MAGNIVDFSRIESLGRVTELYFTPSQQPPSAMRDEVIGRLVHLANLQRLTVLSFADTHITDAGLAHLSGMGELRTLHITNAQISGEGFQSAGLQRLMNLFLGGSQITDGGLMQIASFPNLTSLNLSRTQITDAGITQLRGLPNLQWMNLRNTTVTEQAKAALMASRPGLRVD